jgi:hypothetical protein
LLLGPLEAVGIFLEKGAIDLPTAYEMFGSDVIFVWENAHIQTFVRWSREKPNGSDLYDQLEKLYLACIEYQAKKLDGKPLND